MHSNHSTALITTALKSTDGDIELLRDVIDMFLEEYPTLILQLETAIPLTDFEVVQRASHTIKGTLRMFEDIPAKEIATDLEQMGKSHSLLGAEGKLESLKLALESLRNQLIVGLQNF